jgi:hypothetical protein
MAVYYGTSANGLDGSTSALAAPSAFAIKKANPSATNGVYWINLPTVGATQIFCLMDDVYDGGGWMMAMKATTGTTFNYDSSYWANINTLNPTDVTRNNADAKYNTMNYFKAKDLMALWPDITTTGGGIPNTPVWSWYEPNFYTPGRITLVSLFSTVNRYFKRDAKTFTGWASGIFSSQVDIRFNGFNWTDNLKVRWGFGWNENGGGLYPNGVEGSDDVVGGIGHTYDSAGDRINCCQDTTGINRQARVELYVR